MSFDRLYYTIGQVSKISGLPQSVLRYWETVFESLNPPKSNGGTRQYTENDVEIVLEIKKLLYDEGYTIKGANKHIKNIYSTINETESSDEEEQMTNTSRPENNTAKIDSNYIERIKNRIQSIIQILDE
ncbi:MAG: MerR family transcriptional regulator [Calditrichaceae bacterium]|nr:MerR family transcriptional regulator [Calditrichaceae bacterium]